MKQHQPKLTWHLLYFGIAVGVILLVTGILTGVFFVSEATSAPSGSILQTDAFLPGPYLSITWSCPTGFICPSTSYAAYGQLPNSAVLPSLPDTGLLFVVALVPLAVTLVVALWFLMVFYPWRTAPLPRYRPFPRLLGVLGATTLATEILTLLLVPTFLASDLAKSPSGVPGELGPWNSINGISNFGHLTLIWGPAAGFYLTFAAGILLVVVAALWSRVPQAPKAT